MNNVLLNFFLQEEKNLYYTRHLRKEHSFNKYMLNFQTGIYTEKQRPLVGVDLSYKNSTIFQSENLQDKISNSGIKVLLLKNIMLLKNGKYLLHELDYMRKDEVTFMFDECSQILYCYSKSFAVDIVKAVLRNISLPMKRIVKNGNFLISGTFENLISEPGGDEEISILGDKIVIKDNIYSIDGGNNAIVKMIDKKKDYFLVKVVYSDMEENMEMVIYDQKNKKVQNHIVLKGLK